MAITDDRAASVLPNHLSGRSLEPAELAELSQHIVDRPELWEHLVDHDADERRYESLHVDEHVGVWLICWMKGHDTGFHDHDVSSVGVAVARGCIREERPVWGTQPRCIDPTSGQSFCLDETEIHRMVALTGERTVTVHAYSPPLKRMGMYETEDDGYVRRRPVDWDERLDAN